MKVQQVVKTSDGCAFLDSWVVWRNGWIVTSVFVKPTSLQRPLGEVSLHPESATKYEDFVLDALFYLLRLYCRARCPLR